MGMHPHGNGTLNVDAALSDVARIYRSITGKDLPRNGTPVAPIPPEREPRRVAEDALEQLARLLHRHAPAGPMAAPVPHPLPVPVPAGGASVDCWESASTLFVQMDLPGVRREAIQVVLEGNVLVVRAQRHRDAPDGARPAALERLAGSIERRVLLPGGIDPAHFDAELRDGVLHVTLRRREGAADGRAIPVR
jgi:HSP20 family protein